MAYLQTEEVRSSPLWAVAKARKENLVFTESTRTLCPWLENPASHEKVLIGQSNLPLPSLDLKAWSCGIFIIQRDSRRASLVFVRQDLLMEVANNLFPNAFFSSLSFYLPETWEVSCHLALFRQEVRETNPGRDLVLKNYSQIITTLLLRGAMAKPRPQPQVPKNMDLGPALEFIHNNYQMDFSLEELARIVNYSTYYFTRIFKRETGKTPFEYLTELRIDKAKHFLNATEMSVTEICYKCGYHNISHFTTAFKRVSGMCPRDYRRSLPEGCD